MGTNEKFCLRWNDFESNISVAFREIREDKDFFDCTLSVGDKQLQAHKLILSACSPFFRSVLRKNPHQHPLIYLKGVEFSDLQSVLNFMYHGEVNVAQEELNSFLAVAEDLKVKGLTQNNSSHGEDTIPEQANKNINIPIQSKTLANPSANVPTRYTSKNPRSIPNDPPASKRLCPTSQYPITSTQQDDDEIQEVIPVVKTEPVTESQPIISNYQQTVVQTTTYSGKKEQVLSGALTQMGDQAVYREEDGYDYGGYEEEYEGMEATTDESTSRVVSQVDNFISRNSRQVESGEYLCNLCQKIMRNKGNLKQHMEVNHLPKEPRYNCQICGLQFYTSRRLAKHRSKECTGHPS